jgi:thioester reductase-like protein/acyl carrier protein
MVDQLIEHRVSSCTFTTTQLKMLLTAPNRSRLPEWTSLRSMVVGGEKIPPWVVREFHNLRLPQASIFNGYAPSETTVCNSLRKLLPEDAKRLEIPLERPLFPARFYILDDNLDPVLVGLGGELYIGGPIVNNGYVKREEVTAVSFLRDPFASITEIENGDGKLYRTGDAFRLLQDGTIQAIGRIGGDRQVKIRGMRTELGEIENVIYEACQDVDDPEACLVSLVAVVYYETGALGGVLAAYITTNNVGVEDCERQRSLKAYVRLRIRATLPLHMVPSAFVFLSTLPRTVSGKIDYKTMLTWDPPSPEAVAPNGALERGQQLTEIQSTIASIWKKVLNLDASLTCADDFFALGGHSLILVTIQRAIEERFHVTLSLSDMFAAPTIQGMESIIVPHLTRGGMATRVVNGTGTDNSIHDWNASSGYPGIPADNFVDWDKEGSLPEHFDWYVDTPRFRKASAVALTGACTMAGAHFIHHTLQRTDLELHCIAVESSDADSARLHVLSNLEHWCLLRDISPDALSRLTVYEGCLSHPTLGLSSSQIATLDREVHAIYQLDSEVSLLKRYGNLRASNVGSLQFLISLAHGDANNTKAIHYLSTWGVPHLQAWHETELQNNEWLVKEVEMTNMKPGANASLGYLKARWACESMLYQAARRGIPVTIFRSCMCGSSPRSGVALDRTDINRRILEGSLQTGLFPDFSSDRGGGMSWVTADFLVESMLFLSLHHPGRGGRAKIYHLVSDVHVPYTDMALMLSRGSDGQRLRSCEPSEWFRALRDSGNPEMAMQAEVLERWCEAGWVPFGLQAKDTLALLKTAGGIVPPKMERDSLLKLVVGERGF